MDDTVPPGRFPGRVERHGGLPVAVEFEIPEEGQDRRTARSAFEAEASAPVRGAACWDARA